MFKFLKENDKKKHFGLGFLISFAAAWVAFVLFANYMLISGIAVPFIASLIWEWAHLYRSRFSWDDIYAAMVGAVISTLIWLIIVLVGNDWVPVFN
jgi:hypothetical protein